uniref:Glycosyltransferase family 2 protein n=1 Tax=Geobacter metallireducens TaxID=28232 RepID=A0A831TZR8_GEOME
MGYTLAIIIVNWNTAELLRQCLLSIWANTDVADRRVYVVDNASVDHSVAMVREHFPDVVLLENDLNLGFAAGNNLALTRLLAEKELPKYILFLNTDIVLASTTLATTLAAFTADERLGATGPALVYPTGVYQVGGAGYALSVTSFFLYTSLLFKVLPLRLARSFFVDQARYQDCRQAVEVDWLAGACLMVRTRVIQEVGGWNTDYFLYAEDAEYCDRIKTAGWRLVYLPYVRVIHHHGASSGQDTRVNTRWIVPFLRYAREKYPDGRHHLIRLLLVSGTFLRFLLYCAAWAVSRQARFRNKSNELYAYFRTALFLK